jgi:hypothetical protein
MRAQKEIMLELCSKTGVNIQENAFRGQDSAFASISRNQELKGYLEMKLKISPSPPGSPSQERNI